MLTSAGARTKLIVTDGVFSMDGTIANLPAICRIAEGRDAIVMVDDSHAVGVIGPQGRGTPALHGVEDKVHVISGTLGKALGGASGGYISGKREIIDWLRQTSRPYLFSNSLMPAICAAAMKAINLSEREDSLRENITARVKHLRDGLLELGFIFGGKDHPIIPVLVGEAASAKVLADHLLEARIVVAPFCYPVVPKGAARISHAG